MNQRIDGQVLLWHEAVEFWRTDIKPRVRERYRSTDLPALRTSWNDYVDSLHKDGDISSWQFCNWSSPVEDLQDRGTCSL